MGREVVMSSHLWLTPQLFLSGEHDTLCLHTSEASFIELLGSC